MKLRAIILGCGSSAGVPRIGGIDGAGDWGRCDPNEPRNRRSRCSIIVQRADDKLGWDAPKLTTILVDTAPELRLQMLSAKVGRVDAALITHDHADQTHGIDDIRVLAYMGRQRVPVFIDQHTAPHILTRFAYCFEDNPKTGYPAILAYNEMPPLDKSFEIDGPTGPIPVTPFLQDHGPVDSLGFLFGQGSSAIAYSSDVRQMFDSAFTLIKGCHTWIVDALHYKEHPSHSNLWKTLEWIEKVNPKRGVLTNMHIELDYKTVAAETPSYVEPGYDGMVVENT